jgi:hypothetical protein
MATFDLPITCDNIVSPASTNFRIRYRLIGDATWTSFLVSPSTSITVTIPQDSPTTVLDNNRIYDFQVQNINGEDNPLSLITQSIGFTEPEVTFSPTDTTVGVSFPNLSVDIDSYTLQVTTAIDPGTVIFTTPLPTGNVYPLTMETVIPFLDPLTSYRVILNPVANQFTAQFVYAVNTLADNPYPNVTSVTATLS